MAIFFKYLQLLITTWYNYLHYSLTFSLWVYVRIYVGKIKSIWLVTTVMTYIFLFCVVFFLYVYCTGYFLYFYSLNHRIPWNSVRLRTKSFHHNTIKLFLSISYFNLSTPPEYKQCYNCKGAYILEWIWSVLRPKKINEQVLRPKFSKYNATDRSFIFIFIARFPKYYIWYWKLK